MSNWICSYFTKVTKKVGLKLKFHRKSLTRMALNLSETKTNDLVEPTTQVQKYATHVINTCFCTGSKVYHPFPIPLMVPSLTKGQASLEELLLIRLFLQDLIIENFLIPKFPYHWTISFIVISGKRDFRKAFKAFLITGLK